MAKGFYVLSPKAIVSPRGHIDIFVEKAYNIGDVLVIQ